MNIFSEAGSMNLVAEVRLRKRWKREMETDIWRARQNIPKGILFEKKRGWGKENGNGKRLQNIGEWKKTVFRFFSAEGQTGAELPSLCQERERNNRISILLLHPRKIKFELIQILYFFTKEEEIVVRVYMIQWTRYLIFIHNLTYLSI